VRLNIYTWVETRQRGEGKGEGYQVKGNDGYLAEPDMIYGFKYL